MLHGKVLRPPAFGATLASLDAREAEAHAGRRRSCATATSSASSRRTRVGAPRARSRALACRSGTTHAAALRPRRSSSYLQEDRRSGARERPRGGRTSSARWPRRWPRPTHASTQTYTVAYIAHAPLEPRAAVAEWKDGKLTVWTGTQRPFGVRDELAEAFRIPEDKRARDRARHRLRLRRQAHRRRGGRGRAPRARPRASRSRSSGRARRSSPGRTSGPAGVIEVEERRRRRTARSSRGSSTTTTPAASAIRTPYDVAEPARSSSTRRRSPLRQGSYRGLAATANHFAREIAHGRARARARHGSARVPPEEPRATRACAAVLEAAAERFGWAQAQERRRAAASGSPAGSRRAATSRPAPRSQVDRPAARAGPARSSRRSSAARSSTPTACSNQVEGAVDPGARRRALRGDRVRERARS